MFAIIKKNKHLYLRVHGFGIGSGGGQSVWVVIVSLSGSFVSPTILGTRRADTSMLLLFFRDFIQFVNQWDFSTVREFVAFDAL